MKNVLKYIITAGLAIVAKWVIKKYKPSVLMVSGSVGKTSTKEAVAAVLSTRFYVRKSEKSFNTQFGVPFTILNVSNPWGNPLAWLSLIKSSIALLMLPNHYPNMLVLEVGADRPGDLAKILEITTPDAVVITKLPEIPVHVEAYATPEAVREEEFSPAYSLPALAPLIIHSDDQYSLNCSRRVSARTIMYGSTDNAHISISNIDFSIEAGRVVGMKADVTVENAAGRVVVTGSVGKIQLLPVAAALAAAYAYNIPLDDAIEALKEYEPPPGRGRILEGINDSIIIDDTYNSSPAAVEEALETLRAFPSGANSTSRRVAILGDMLELGRYSVAEHERIGQLARESADLVIAVGIRARTFVAKSTTEQSLQFDNSLAAALAIPNMVKSGDILLVKGSQSIRMEKIVEALLADPSDASLLVRQEREWKRKT